MFLLGFQLSSILAAVCIDSSPKWVVLASSLKITALSTGQLEEACILLRFVSIYLRQLAHL